MTELYQIGVIVALGMWLVTGAWDVFFGDHDDL